MSDIKSLLVGFTPTNTKNKFVQTDVAFWPGRGYYATVTVVELENSGGFAVSKCNPLSGMKSFGLEVGKSRFSGKKLASLCNGLKSEIANYATTDDFKNAVATVCVAENVTLRNGELLTRDEAYGAVQS